MKFQFDQDLLFVIICERKCNPGSETASLTSWPCASGLGFPEIPECRGTGVPRIQSWPRNLGTWMLWLPRAFVCPGWNWAKTLLTLEDLGVWIFAAGSPRTFWVTGPCKSIQWLSAELGAWKCLWVGPHRSLKAKVTNHAWKEGFHWSFIFELLSWNILTMIIWNCFKEKQFWSSVKLVSWKDLCKFLDVLLWKH